MALLSALAEANTLREVRGTFQLRRERSSGSREEEPKNNDEKIASQILRLGCILYKVLLLSILGVVFAALRRVAFTTEVLTHLTAGVAVVAQETKRLQLENAALKLRVSTVPFL